MNFMTHLQGLVSGIGPFFILLGMLIFVHEMGHFLVAKFFGVRVEVFSLGFGKRLFSFKRGDTVYCLSLIPLGGYVKMFGDDPSADIPAHEKQYAFLHKPVMQRIWIVLAGPLMNLFFAIALFTAIGGLGVEMSGPFVGDVPEDSKAFDAGFRPGDKVLSIGGKPTPTWMSMNAQLEKAGGRAVEVVLERRGEPQPLKFDVSVSFGENENIFSSERQVGQIQGLTHESRSTLVGVKSPGTPAAKSGLQTLDLITSINGVKVNYWRELQPVLLNALATGSDSVEMEVRDLQASTEKEITRKVKVEVPKGWDEKTNLAEWLGLEAAELYIFQIKKDSPAAKAGIEVRDRVIRINNQDVHAWVDVLNKVKSYDPSNEGMEFTVLRNGEEKTFKIQPEMTELMTTKGQEEKRFTIGIVSGFLPAGPETVFHRVHGPINLLKHGLSETAKWTEFVAMSVVRLIQGDVSAKNIGGVITIGRVASHSFAAGVSTFLHTMAIISINLFLLNLLPIPILDGGHLVFYTYEGLRGTPLSMRKMELAQQIGLMLLMFLMVFAFYNDITNLLSSRW